MKRILSAISIVGLCIIHAGWAYAGDLTVDGMVGIGTTGQISGIASAKLTVMQTPTTNDWAVGIKGGINTGGSYGLRIDAGTGSNDYSFYVNNSNSSNLLNVRGDGNVGIGTTYPASKLEVNGVDSSNGLVNFQVSDPANNPVLNIRQLNSGGNPWDHQGLHIDVRGAGDALYVENNGTPGLVVNNSGNVGIGIANPQYKLDVAGNIRGNNVSPSDIRWKKNITLIESALDKVMKLSGVSFDWRTDEYRNMGFEENRQIGFIGQDVEPVLPELVTTDKDGYKAVSYEKMTAVLVEAIKAQQKEIDILKEVIKTLSGNDGHISR